MTAIHRALAATAAVLVFAGLCVASALAQPSADLLQMRKQMLEPSVRLTNGCSGQVIYSKRDQEKGEVTTLILTAKHCVSDMAAGASLEVRFPDYDSKGRLVSEKVYVALVEAQDFASDVALLKLRDTETYFSVVAKIAPEKVVLYEGEPTWAVGYPLGWQRTLTVGVMGVSHRVALAPYPEKDYLRSTPNIAPGSSGGGLYHKNDNGDYELIGTTTAGPMPYFFMGLWTPTDDTHVFLKRVAPIAYKDLFPGASAAK